MDERKLMEDLMRKGDPFCVKKRPTGDEKAGTFGYSAFGVISDRCVPIDIYLRAEDHNPANDFKRVKQYASLDAMLADGWIVD